MVVLQTRTGELLREDMVAVEDMEEEEGHIQGQDLGQGRETGTGGVRDQDQDPEAGGHETGHTANPLAEVGQEVDHHRAGRGHAQGPGHQNRMKLEMTDSSSDNLD